MNSTAKSGPAGMHHAPGTSPQAEMPAAARKLGRDRVAPASLPGSWSGPSPTRRAIGSLFALLLLSGISAGATPSAPRNEGVILLHGLARSAASLGKMESALRGAGYTVVNVDYPSRTATIEELSDKAIGGALTDPRLAACATVHFVTHSLGGILVRDYLARRPIPALGRVVMLGPPNGGSEVVDRLRDWTLFEKVNGPAGQQLGTDAKSVPRQLGPVTFEVGIIAGNRSINWINSAMIDGPDDGKVSVEHTKVAGMKDHLVLPVTHPLMMRDGQVIAACLRFLETGRFRE